MSRSRQYGQDEKQAVALTFAIKGSVRQTAKDSGVPYQTVRGWTKTEWFQVILDQVRQEKDQEWDSKLSAVIDDFIERLRTEGAELSIDRLPVALGILYDKLRLHRNQPTSIRRTETAEQRIEKLHRTYAELSRQGDLGKAKVH